MTSQQGDFVNKSFDSTSWPFVLIRSIFIGFPVSMIYYVNEANYLYWVRTATYSLYAYYEIRP